jgi:hypothetical protein
MEPTQRFVLAHFSPLPLTARLELLIAQRKALFAQEQQLLARQAELGQQKQEWLARRTIHELQCRLFWLKLRKAALANQKGEAEPTVTGASLPIQPLERFS